MDTVPLQPSEPTTVVSPLVNQAPLNPPIIPNQQQNSIEIVLVVLGLVFFYPIGVILMWFLMKSWRLWVKLLITLIPIVFILIGSISYFAASMNRSSTQMQLEKLQQQHSLDKLPASGTSFH